MSPTSPEQQDKHPPDAGEAVLRIVSGLHVGASRPLSRREMILIGSGDDCDVVLADAGVPCNMLAGYYHDHLLVPSERAAEALELLRTLASGA